MIAKNSLVLYDDSPTSYIVFNTVIIRKPGAIPYNVPVPGN